jgi:Tetratricopeptide repeat
MKREWKWLFPVVLALTLTEPQPATAGLIVDVDGAVAIKRAGAAEYAPTGVGTQIFPGDEVKTERGKVTILASDLTRFVLSDRDESFLLSPFAGKEPIEEKCPTPQGNITCPRGPIDLEVPYIISPRRTKVLNSTFKLSWNPVTDASFYKVSFKANGDIVWQTETGDTEYENVSVLEPNTPYLLIVETNNGRSSHEEIDNGAVGLGFELLEEAKIAEIQKAIAKLKELGLSPEAETLALAHLYIGAELRLAAIEQLTSLIEKGDRNPAIHRTLGDVYAAIGLNALAEKVYLEAFKLANSTGDLEEQAAAAAGLAEVYEILTNYREAHNWVTEALQRYQQLSDRDQVDELNLILERLSELV